MIARRKPLARTAPRRKWNAVRTEYGGRVYDSAMEARYAALLDLRMRSTLAVDRVIEWWPQVPVKLEVNGTLVTTYIVDFLIQRPDVEEWVEVKGVWTPEARLKTKLFRALFPERRLLIVTKVRT